MTEINNNEEINLKNENVLRERPRRLIREKVFIDKENKVENKKITFINKIPKNIFINIFNYTICVLVYGSLLYLLAKFFII